MRTIICTTGTSIARNVKRPEPWRAEEYKRAVVARVDSERQLKSRDSFLDGISAETKSLRALKAGSNDEVFLLHTDTEDGRVCAEVVAGVLADGMKIQAQAKCVKGLQVEDANAFRRTGVDNLFAMLKEFTSGRAYGSGDEVILNVTGGFKAVVPFVTIFGLLHRIDVVYIFEQSTSLIRLPPLPVQYDYERIKQAEEALRRLREADIMGKEDFFAAIPGLDHADRRWYECLLEEADGQVALSAIAKQLLDTNQEGRAKVLLHPNAYAAYERAAGSVARDQFDMMMSRVGEPMWRSQKRHAFSGTDLEVYKPGNTKERLAGFLEGRTFYVCELYLSHEEYERVLGTRSRKQYRGADFQPWMPPTGKQVAETAEQLAAQVQAELNEKNRECRDLEAVWGEDTRKHKTEQTRLHAVIADLEGSAKEKEREIDHLQEELDFARRPWWRRLFNHRGRKENTHR